VTVANKPIVVTSYSRQEALRILRIHPNQLTAWERLGLVTERQDYSFQHLVQLRKLRDLRASRLSAARIRNCVHAMRQVSGMANPLLETSAVRSGSRLAFRLEGAMVDPVAHQFVFDFDFTQSDRLAEVGASSRQARVASLFLEAVQKEEQGDLEEAALFYESILEIDQRHAPSCINLGTICYNRRQFLEAESLYRRAAQYDPNYALAFFDLGNALDELQRLPEAIEAYRNAIRLVPFYADAHYNLALAYERVGEPRRALVHWNTYRKLDPIGPWANHARGRSRKILEQERLLIVRRNALPRREWQCRRTPSFSPPPLP
jgi:tetratricopeptide (TPR) repeat protein